MKTEFFIAVGSYYIFIFETLRESTDPEGIATIPEDESMLDGPYHSGQSYHSGQHYPTETQIPQVYHQNWLQERIKIFHWNSISR